MSSAGGVLPWHEYGMQQLVHCLLLDV
jgi:hypothetical protein